MDRAVVLVNHLEVCVRLQMGSQTGGYNVMKGMMRVVRGFEEGTRYAPSGKVRLMRLLGECWLSHQLYYSVLNCRIACFDDPSVVALRQKALHEKVLLDFL